MKIKKPLLLNLVFTAIFCLIATKSNAQFAFSVSPGIQLNGASFGYKIKKVVPFVSLQVLNGSVSSIEKGNRYDRITGTIVSYEDKVKLTGSIYMPTVGTKYFFKQSNKLKAYGIMSFTKFIISASIENSSNITSNVDLQKQLSGINIFGGLLGFGTEYFFDDNFSIGGEFGMRMIYFNQKRETSGFVYNQNTGEIITSKTTFDYTSSFKPTYARISLNYYFANPSDK
ncbi:MAG: hypothetical protein V4667_04725 [Bacteroidota bacterium]